MSDTSDVQLVMDITDLRHDVGAPVQWLDVGFVPSVGKHLSLSKTKSTTTIDMSLPDEITRFDTKDSARMRGNRSRRNSKRSANSRRSSRSTKSSKSHSPARILSTRSRSSTQPAKSHSLSPLAEERSSDSLPSQEPDICSDYSSHILTEYKAPRAVECKSCNRVASPGEMMWGCSKCSFDHCVECLPEELKVEPVVDQPVILPVPQLPMEISTTQSTIQISVEAARASVTPLQPEVARASWSVSPSSSSLARASLSPSPSSSSLSPMVQRTSSSTSSSKTCKFCKKAWKGFGDTCSACRKAGPDGPIRQCHKCGAFWQGWNDCTACN